MHDQGPLATLREGGPGAWLVGSIIAAKKCNDEYLTKRIIEERKKSAITATTSQQQVQQQDDSQPSKKAKVNQEE